MAKGCICGKAAEMCHASKHPNVSSGLKLTSFKTAVRYCTCSDGPVRRLNAELDAKRL